MNFFNAYKNSNVKNISHKLFTVVSPSCVSKTEITFSLQLSDGFIKLQTCANTASANLTTDLFSSLLPSMTSYYSKMDSLILNSLLCAIKSTAADAQTCMESNVRRKISNQ